MFTGIIEEVGELKELKRLGDEARITVSCRRVWEGLEIGDSVAVNGVCLTAVETAPGYFAADVSEESLQRSNLGGLKRGAALNLERAMRLGSRLGGHIVQGHVDGGGYLKSARDSGRGRTYAFAAPPEVQAYLVEKGSIAVDGISLTVSALGDGEFSVAAIPHTVEETNLRRAKSGDAVNLEVDVIAKYVRSYMERGLPRGDGSAASGSLRERLVEGGFM